MSSKGNKNKMLLFSSASASNPGEMAIDATIPITGADIDAVVKSVPAEVKTYCSAHLNLLYGTSVSSVVAAFLESLIKAREAKNCSALLADMLLAVFISQTVSKEWVALYDKLAATSMFKRFEISGQRKADSAKTNSSWVSASKMNATPINLMGQMIMECAAIGSSLNRKAKESGTIFSPVDNGTEYSEITIDRAREITDADRSSLKQFQDSGKVLIIAICKILETGATDTGELYAKATKMGYITF